MSNPPENPYVGTRTFSEEDAPRFFGREREARDLLALVAFEQVVLFYAQSGTGKSSLVNTKLIPGLEKDGRFEVLPPSRVSGDIPPRASIQNVYVYSLMQNLAGHTLRPDRIGGLRIKDFLPKLVRDTDSERRSFIIAEEGVETQKRRRRVLIIDQFEELFTTHPEEWESRSDFFEQLAEALEEDPNLWVVLVMREDYIAYLDPHSHLMPGGLRVRYYMQKMEYEDALKAVKKPAENEGRPYKEDVAEQLVKDLRGRQLRRTGGNRRTILGQYVEPIVLQAVCSTLWENLDAKDPDITLSDLKRLGNVNKALGKYYEKRVHQVAMMDEVKKLGIRESEIRNWIGTQLITSDGRRNIVVRGTGGKSGGLDDSVVQLFSKKKDLIREEGHGAASIYELTHDRLAEPILENNREWEKEHGFPFYHQMLLWSDTRGRNKEAHLLSETALAEAEKWISQNPDQLSNQEKEFLEACRAKIQAEENRRDQELKQQEKALEDQKKEASRQLAMQTAKSARRFNIVAGMLAIIALIASGIAFAGLRSAKTSEGLANSNAQALATSEANAIQQAVNARSSELSTIGLVLSDTQLDLALLLGIEADSISPTEKTYAVLTTLLQKSAPYLRTIQSQEEIQEIQFTHDGETFASRDKDGITLWDADTFQPLNETPLNDHFAGVTALAVSADGSLLASGGSDGTFIIWDVSTRQIISEPIKAEIGSIICLAFSADGNLLATAGSNTSTVILWDISVRTDPRKKGELAKHQSSVLTMAFSSDGKTLATGSYDRTIILWDITAPEKPEVHSVISEHTDWVNKLSFLNGSDDFLISASDDSRIILWDVSDPKAPDPLAEEANETFSYVRGLAISPDGKTVASGNTDSSIILWAVSETNKLSKLGPLGQTNVGINPNLLVFSEDGNTIASSAFNGTLVVWDVSSRSLVSETSTAVSSASSAMVLAPGNDTVIMGGYDSLILYWDMSDPEKPQKIGEPLQGHLGQPTSMRFSSDGSLLETSGQDGTILYNVSSQVPPTQLGYGVIYSVSPDGKYLAYQTLNRSTGEYLIHITDTISGEAVFEPIAGQNSIFSPDSERLVIETRQSNGSYRLNIWDMVNKVKLPSPGSGYAAVFSPDSSMLIYQSTNQFASRINLWDVENGENIIQDIEGTFPIISSNGKILLYQISDAVEAQIGLYDIDSAEFLEERIPGSILASRNNETLVFSTYDPNNGVTSLNSLNLSTLHEPGTNNFDTDEIESGTFLTLSSDGRILIFQDPSGGINVFDTQQGRTTYPPVVGSLIGLVQDGRAILYQASDGAYLLDTNGQSAPYALRGTYLTTTPDNRIVVYRAFENNINNLRLWDISKNKNIGVPVNESFGSFFSISPNGETLVLKNERNELIFWDETVTWPLGEPFNETPGETSMAAISPDGTTLAWLGKDSVTLQGTRNASGDGEPFNDHYDIGFPGVLPAFSPDGKILAIGNQDFASGTETTNLWDLSTQTQIGKELPGFWSVFSADGKLLAIGSQDLDSNSIGTTVWDLSTQTQVGKELPGFLPAFSPDGKLLAIGGLDLDSNSLITTLWDMETQTQVGKELPGFIPIFSLDGKILVIGNQGSESSSNTTTLWDLSTQTRIGKELPGFFPAFSPDGKILAIGNQDFESDTNTTTLWELETQTQIGKELPGYIPAFSPDGKILAIGNEDFDTNTNTTTLWQMNDLKPPTQMHGVALPPTSFVFSADGKMLASRASDGIVLRNLDANSSFPLDAGEFINRITDRMSFYANDTRFVAIIDDGSLVTWDVVSGLLNEPEESDQRFGFFTGIPIFSPDGNYLVYSDGSFVKLWDVFRTQPSIETAGLDVSDPQSVRIAFSPDGTIMALADGLTIRLYNFPEWTKIGEELDTGTFINGLGLVMQDDSRVKYLFVLDYSGNTQIWDMNTLAKVGDPIPGNIKFIGSSTEDHTIFYIDSNGRLIKYEWDMEIRILKELLCTRVGRNFTRDELAQNGFTEPYPTNQDEATCPQWPLPSGATIPISK